MDQDADDLAELLNPRSREERYYAVLDEQKELAGFFSCTKDGETVEIGLGLRPDLTGKGTCKRRMAGSMNSWKWLCHEPID